MGRFAIFSSIEYLSAFCNGLVQEFFTEDHWSKLPPSWQSCLGVMPLPSFCHQLFRLPVAAGDQEDADAPIGVVLPLSLLAFAALARTLSHQRQPQTMHAHKDASHQAGFSSWSSPVPNGHQMAKDVRHAPSQIADLEHLFRRHVKLKKQHEIIRLAEVNRLDKKEWETREGERETGL